MGKYVDNAYISEYSGAEIEQAIKFMQTQIAPIWDDDIAYKKDDFVIYDGQLYQCHKDTQIWYGWTGERNWTLQKVFNNDGYLIIQTGTSTKNVEPIDQLKRKI